jgi:hypothetical protein
MKPQETGLTGETGGLYYGQVGDTGAALAADRVAGEWAARQAGGNTYTVSPVPEQLLRYYNDAPFAGSIVMAGELVQG